MLDHVMRSLALLLLAGLSIPLLSAAPQNLVLILDASGSMWGRLGSETKIESARRVVRDLAGKLPADSKLGLVAYGHRRKGDCSDIETLAPAGSADGLGVADRVDKLNPLGMTPITKAFEQGAATAKQAGAPGTIVLVTDGLETCGGDPCAAVRAAKAAGQDFVLHIVGFDVAKENVSSLECSAQAGGGLYIPAENAEQLAGALEQTMTAEAPVGDATLSVQSVMDGKLQDALVKVLQPGKPDVGGRTYAGAETNPRRFALQAGTYDVVVEPLGIQGASPVRFDGVTLEAGKVVEKVANFSTGELAVKVTRNGSLQDAAVTVRPAGESRTVAGGRTYTASSSNPRVFRVPPGRYDVSVEVLGVGTGVKQVFEAVEVVGEGRAEREYAIETGTLAIGSVQGTTLIDSTVSVVNEAGQAVAGGRTYTAATSNPKVFELPVGKYTVKVQPVRPPGLAAKTTTVEVKPGAKTEQTAAF